jgi:hypothetical protein
LREISVSGKWILRKGPIKNVFFGIKKAAVPALNPNVVFTPHFGPGKAIFRALPVAVHYELTDDRRRIIFIAKSAGNTCRKLVLLKLSPLFADSYAIRRPAGKFVRSDFR